MENIRIIHAIQALLPNAECSVKGDDCSGIVWLDEREQPTDKQITDKLAELRAEYDAQKYARARRPLYPAIGDQLDDLYHAGVFSADMTAKLKKVKDDNPK